MLDLTATDLHPAVRARLGDPGRYVVPHGARVIVARRYPTPVLFTVNNLKDRIHAVHAKGRFYEPNVLEALAARFPEGGTFADVGANVGNHGLYFLTQAGAGRVIPFEMNPDAITLQISNYTLNNLLDRVTLDTLGYGLDEGAADGVGIRNPHANLGWARVDKSAAGEVSLRTGDSLIGDRHVDMIKIDVEGMEIGALKGLRQTIKRCRPMLFVEVDHENQGDFDDLMEAWDYEVDRAFEQTRVNRNVLMRPAEAD